MIFMDTVLLCFSKPHALAATCSKLILASIAWGSRCVSAAGRQYAPCHQMLDRVKRAGFKGIGQI